MDSFAKFEMMQKVLTNLETFKEVQTAIIKKIICSEAYSVELGDTQLEMKLADIYESVSQNLEKVETAFSFYQQKLDAFANENHFKAEVIA